MARFIGRVQGNRGGASRLSGPVDGISTEAAGWNVGVKVRGWADGDNDVFDVYATGGSNGFSPSRHVARVKLNADGNVEVIAMVSETAGVI